jgi:hypothetical protein
MNLITQSVLSAFLSFFEILLDIIDIKDESILIFLSVFSNEELVAKFNLQETHQLFKNELRNKKLT